MDLRTLAQTGLGTLRSAEDLPQKLVRIIIEPPIKDGLFVQPKKTGPERELVENHNRLSFANKFHFADPFTGLTRTFDPIGRYNCGRCNQADGKKCLEVSGITIDLEAGSCQDWENLCAGDPEVKLTLVKCTDANKSNYGVAKNGVGFGCIRCPYGSKAYEPDSQGRTMYCGKGDFRTFDMACCSLNGAETK